MKQVLCLYCQIKARGEMILIFKKYRMYNTILSNIIYFKLYDQFKNEWKRLNYFKRKTPIIINKIIYMNLYILQFNKFNVRSLYLYKYKSSEHYI